MGNGEDLVERLQTIFTYNLLSIFFVFVLLFIYGVGRDFLLYGIYDTAVSLNNMGTLQSWVLGFLETAFNTSTIIPQSIDVLWLVLTIGLFAELIVSSYYAKREGWFSILGFLTFGIVFFLFIAGVFAEMGTWFTTNFINGMFGSIIYSTPFLNFYLSHLFLVNLILAVLCVLANFIDLDFSRFESRKDRENLNEVI